MAGEWLTVGELARRSGISVRTLHHYDEIRLLSPRRRSPSGHRRYGEEDIRRLQQILSLRQLGFPLREIGHCLAQPEFSIRRVLEMHVERLRQQIAQRDELRRRLERLLAHFDAEEEVPAREFLEAMEMMTMMENYFTREQRDRLQQRAREVGEDRIREVEEEWPRLIARVRSAMEAGKDPASDEVRVLARRWMELVREFSGGDAGIERSVGRMYSGEPRVRQRMGLDAAILEYVGRARAVIDGGS